MPNDKFSKLTWHKRTHGHEFTGAEFRVLMSIFDHSDEHGRKSHPGLKRLMDETGYSKSAISEALKALQARGWITQSSRGSGVSGRASVYELVPDAPSRSSGLDQSSNGGSSAGVDQLPEVGPVERTSRSSGLDLVGPVEWTPSDPDIKSGSDPYRSDQGEVRQSPNHQEDQDETGHESRSLAVAGSEATGARASGTGNPPATEDRPAKSTQAEPASAGATEAPEENRPVGLQPLAPSSSTDPFASEPAWRAEGRAREKRAARLLEPASASRRIPDPFAS
ncbi:helix-turn-helix domain-containing protein [Rhodococcus sp. LB1]|uniref:helix-turn-helix domain-containing protein n=1 Tax=Rhodococcus sp. LB1 TaxID=1807499 RepID=UPI000A70D5B0